MISIGPISSIYDFLTFFMMLWAFQASETPFHTGWLVELLVAQTQVLFIIRTAGTPLHSRPSRPLAITTILVVCVGIILPFTPLAGPLSFTPLPGLYFLLLVGMTITYLLRIEGVKRRLMRRLILSWGLCPLH
jgi:Mg2+-importing ATPase